MGTFLNSEGPDEMPHKGAFHKVYTVWFMSKKIMNQKNV